MIQWRPQKRKRHLYTLIWCDISTCIYKIHKHLFIIVCGGSWTHDNFMMLITCMCLCVHGLCLYINKCVYDYMYIYIIHITLLWMVNRRWQWLRFWSSSSSSYNNMHAHSSGYIYDLCVVLSAYCVCLCDCSCLNIKYALLNVFHFTVI